MARLIPADRCRRFCTVDLAVSTKTSADWTVIATWALTPDRDFLLLDLERRRLEGPDIVPALEATFQRWRPTFIGVEKVAFQAVILQTAQRAGLPIRELRPDKDKITRALPAAARMEGGGVYWRAGAHWVAELEAELLLFRMRAMTTRSMCSPTPRSRSRPARVGYPATIVAAPDIDLPRPTGIFAGRSTRMPRSCTSAPASFGDDATSCYSKAARRRSRADPAARAARVGCWAARGFVSPG